MKKLIFALLIVMSTANASELVKLEKGDTALTFASSGKIVSKEMYFPPCPPNAMCMPATLITVSVNLNGCVDRLGPVTHKLRFDESEGKYVLEVAAININNKKSTVVRCFARPSKTIKIMANPGVLHDDLDLVFLK